MVALLFLAGMLTLAGVAERSGGWPVLTGHRGAPSSAEVATARTRLPDLLAFRPVSINRATAAELMAAPGIGPVLAARIIAARGQRGGFSSLAEVAAVPGIGRAKLAALGQLFTAP